MAKYYYRVDEYFNDFNGKSFSCSEKFDDRDLRKASKEARVYYEQRFDGIINKGDFFGKKFAGYENYKHGVNAAFSICLILVEVITTTNTDSMFYNGGESEEIEWFLLGEDDEMCEEGLELEQHILK